MGLSTLPASVTTTAQSRSKRPRIRAAERADLLAVYRIEQDVFPQPWPFSAFEQYLGEPGFLVAEDEAVVGYVVADTIHNHGQRMGHIKDLAVHEAHRREGIATTLLTQAISVLEGQGVRAVKLEVRETNDSAIDLYQSEGFVHRKTVPNYYNDGENAHVLVREL